MSETVVAKRYADALFQLATEKGIDEKLISELQTVKEVFLAEKQVNDFLNHPRVTNEQKLQLIDASFAQLDKYVQNTLKLLVERHRVNVIPLIVDEYENLYNESRNIAVATVYSTRALTDDEKAKLENSFKTRFNKEQITIEKEVEPSIINGKKKRRGNKNYRNYIKGNIRHIQM